MSVSPSEFRKTLAEELREELDDLYLAKFELPPGIKPIAIRVFQHPDGGPVYALVEADGEIHLCEIEGYRLKYVGKLLAKGQLGVSSWVLGSVAYDDINDNWLTFFHNSGSDMATFVRFDRELKSILSSAVDIAGTEHKSFLGAFRPYKNEIAGQKRGLYVFVDGGEGTCLWKTNDYSVSVPTFAEVTDRLLAEAKSYVSYNNESGHGYALDFICSPIHFRDHVVWLQGTHSVGAEYSLVPAFAIYDRQKDTWVGGMAEKPIITPLRSGYLYGLLIGAELTTLLNRRFTLITVEWRSSGAEEILGFLGIYAYRFNPEWLNPRTQPVTWHVWVEKSISAGETSPAFPGFGRKTIHFTSDTSGDLTAYLDAIGRNDWKPVLTQTGVTSALTQTAYSGLRMRLKFSAAAKVSAYVVAEP